MDDDPAPLDDAVIEATRRSGLVWVRPDGAAREHPVWHVVHDGAAYVVTGGREQPFPPCTRAVVVVRSRARQGDRVAEWAADVAAVEVGSAEWDAVVPLLHAGRLNAPDGEAQPVRWARESSVLRLSPSRAPA